MKITARHLFEIAGLPVPYILLVEGYKEATAEFSAISPDAQQKSHSTKTSSNEIKQQVTSGISIIGESRDGTHLSHLLTRSHLVQQKRS